MIQIFDFSWQACSLCDWGAGLFYRIPTVKSLSIFLKRLPCKRFKKILRDFAIQIWH